MLYVTELASLFMTKAPMIRYCDCVYPAASVPSPLNLSSLRGLLSNLGPKDDLLCKL